ncbi:conjugal transfer protein [Ruminococcus sp. AF13-37]|nr:conjugal transfer protein [Ruminococcus sp. AF13-37]
MRFPVTGQQGHGHRIIHTELINFPLYCPKCKAETLINIKYGKVTVIKEPDAKTQSR